MAYSPILALATASFEIAVAVWTIRGPGDRPLVRITTAILVLLAGYQIAEVVICANLGNPGFLPRFAFLDVTWLPALGLTLIARVHQPRSSTLFGIGRAITAAAAGIAIWILLDGSFASASVCSAVYARYTHAMPRFLVYAIYYWLGLSGMLLLSAYAIVTGTNDHRKRLMSQIFLGTAGFVLPSIAVSYFVPTVAGALPSIMCHFALILAFFLARMVAIERRKHQTEASQDTVGQAA